MTVRSVGRSAGAPAIGGTLAAVIAGATHGYGGPQRGVVRTTWEGGSAAPVAVPAHGDKRFKRFYPPLKRNFCV